MRQDFLDLIAFGKMLSIWVVFVVFMVVLIYSCIAGKELPDMVWVVVTNWKH